MEALGSTCYEKVYETRKETEMNTLFMYNYNHLLSLINNVGDAGNRSEMMYYLEHMKMTFQQATGKDLCYD